MDLLPLVNSRWQRLCNMLNVESGQIFFEFVDDLDNIGRNSKGDFKVQKHVGFY